MTKVLSNLGKDDKRWGNRDNWDRMGLKEMKPKVKGKKKK